MGKVMTHLEEKLAHLERIVDDLSSVIARQDADLMRLTRHVEQLLKRERAREAEAGGGVIVAGERPPHY